MYFWQVISRNDFDIHVVARSFVTGRRYRSHCSASCSDVPKNLSHGMRQADDISNFVTDVHMCVHMYVRHKPVQSDVSAFRCVFNMLNC